MAKFTKLKVTELEMLEKLFPTSIGFIAKASENSLRERFVKDYFTLPSGLYDSKLLQNILNEISAIQQNNVNYSELFELSNS